jgi:hypothetical protein
MGGEVRGPAHLAAGQRHPAIASVKERASIDLILNVKKDGTIPGQVRSFVEGLVLEDRNKWSNEASDQVRTFMNLG